MFVFNSEINQFNIYGLDFNFCAYIFVLFFIDKKPKPFVL